MVDVKIYKKGEERMHLTQGRSRHFGKEGCHQARVPQKKGDARTLLTIFLSLLQMKMTNFLIKRRGANPCTPLDLFFTVVRIGKSKNNKLLH